MIRRLVCRLLRHDHSKVRILVTFVEGDQALSHRLDMWTAEWIIANVISVDATWAGRQVASCRLVFE